MWNDNSNNWATVENTRINYTNVKPQARHSRRCVTVLFPRAADDFVCTDSQDLRRWKPSRITKRVTCVLKSLFYIFYLFCIGRVARAKPEKTIQWSLNYIKLKNWYAHYCYIYAYLQILIGLKILMNKCLPMKTHFTI